MTGSADLFNTGEWSTQTGTWTNYPYYDCPAELYAEMNGGDDVPEVLTYLGSNGVTVPASGVPWEFFATFQAELFPLDITEETQSQTLRMGSDLLGIFTVSYQHTWNYQYPLGITSQTSLLTFWFLGQTQTWSNPFTSDANGPMRLEVKWDPATQTASVVTRSWHTVGGAQVDQFHTFELTGVTATTTAGTYAGWQVRFGRSAIDPSAFPAITAGGGLGALTSPGLVVTEPEPAGFSVRGISVVVCGDTEC